MVVVSYTELVACPDGTHSTNTSQYTCLKGQKSENETNYGGMHNLAHNQTLGQNSKTQRLSLFFQVLFFNNHVGNYLGYRLHPMNKRHNSLRLVTFIDFCIFTIWLCIQLPKWYEIIVYKTSITINE